MKKFFLSAMMLTTLFGASQAQIVREDSFSHLSLRFNTPDAVVDAEELGGSKYAVLNIDGYAYSGAIGSPALPVYTDIIVVPFCSEMKVSVSNAVYDTLNANVNLAWMPLQPSRSKSDTSALRVVYNENVYNTDAFVSMPLAKVEELGIARDRRLARLTFSPVSINPVTGQYVVCRQADITVTYVGADSAATMEHFERYYTPAFSVGSTLNSLVSAKAVRTSAPVRMVVVNPVSLNCAAINNFVKWKRRQGYIVDRVTYGAGDITTNTELANYLKELYTNATTAEPAPTYIVLIGDNEQLPAFDSQLPDPPSSWWGSSGNANDHITDLYFATWTPNDILPDCYQGRLSATNTTTVGNIINKILLYETYAFSDDAYLAKAILVSGVDQGRSSDQAYKYCDPTMDYAARYYINVDNGFVNVKYYKNNTNHAPVGGLVAVTGSSNASNAAADLRTLYNDGAGWVNYSAHGDWDCWHKPNFSVSNVNSMTNSGKPMVMVGNCCLSNKFDQSVCFGESLLRKGDNAGAVAYIGATNSTYWNEDFCWSVGIRTNISNTMDATYNSSRLGVYDRMFHTHGETFANYAITAGAMVFFGNMSVDAMATTSGVTPSYDNSNKYYWEIYELMGDPSMMPWLGRAQELSGIYVAYPEDQSSPCEVSVLTVPYAYVALRDTVETNTANQLIGAAFADAEGVATITIDDCTGLAGTVFSVTAQGYKPFFYNYNTLGVKDVADANEVSLYPNPATSQCVVAADGMQKVSLLDSRGCLVGVYAAADGKCTIDLQMLPRGVYFVQVQAANSLSAKKLVVK